MKIDIDYAIVIDAPSLVYFKYIGHVGRGYTLRNIESLEKVDITIFHLKDVDRDRSAALLRGICNVRVLHLSINNYDAQLFRGPLNSVPAFYNLVELEFKNHCNDCKLFPEEVISCLLYHLKEISIFCFRGDTHTFEMDHPVPRPLHDLWKRILHNYFAVAVFSHESGSGLTNLIPMSKNRSEIRRRTEESELCEALGDDLRKQLALKGG
ncbi:hypothetical protein V6N12_001105 [Hibiscus sabdariffa]|uniref:Uncharacterized protein n=1 Tax=Hibiscus sabdariffa TaxID=183260 RepID=A0ABR2C6A3_9ROSI